MTYFAVESPADLSGWTSLAALATDPAVLAAKVAATRAMLGPGTEPRAAASIDFLGVAARVLSPALGWAVADARVPVLAPDQIWWRAAVPGPMRLAVEVQAWREASASALLDAVIRPALSPVLAAYRTAFALSGQVLWGNVASALNGAATSIGTPGAQTLVRELLVCGELAETARALPPRFMRNSCCLFYRLPAGGLCGDCVLRRRAG